MVSHLFRPIIPLFMMFWGRRAFPPPETCPVTLDSSVEENTDSEIIQRRLLSGDVIKANAKLIDWKAASV